MDQISVNIFVSTFIINIQGNVELIMHSTSNHVALMSHLIYSFLKIKCLLNSVEIPVGFMEMF